MGDSATPSEEGLTAGRNAGQWLFSVLTRAAGVEPLNTRDSVPAVPVHETGTGTDNSFKNNAVPVVPVVPVKKHSSGFSEGTI